MSRRKVAELETPFSTVQWPPISQEDQDTILQLLCTLLSPIGQHRREYIVPSQGKRSRKEQKKEKKTRQQDDASPKPAEPDVPPPPELAKYVDVGLTQITRVLAETTSTLDGKDEKDESKKPAITYTAVFVLRSGHPSVFYSHFPHMVAAASRACPSSPIRLVGFSRACEDRLSACLGIPRVSSIALRVGAPRSQGLVNFLTEHVPPVDARWLAESQSGQYLPTQIHIADVPVGQKKQKRAVAA